MESRPPRWSSGFSLSDFYQAEAWDNKNYYVCQVNPMEANFRLYQVVNGKRTQLGTADTEQKKWCTIHVVQKGPEIQCWLNGELLLKAKDDTIKAPGRVGLWTKADAVTSFDQFQVRAAK